MLTIKLKNGVEIKLNFFILIGTVLLAHYFHSWILAFGIGCMVLAI